LEVYLGNDILSISRSLATQNNTASPTTGGSLTVNGNAAGNYDVFITGTAGQNNNCISFVDTDWSTSTQEHRF
jgi:hypothetical protein